MKIIETQDGSHSLMSDTFGASYHSKYGAIRESRHVFVEAGLFFKVLTKKKLRVLEIGFGTGLNAFLTFFESERLGLHIDYVAVEAHPVPLEIASQLNFPVLLDEKKPENTFLTMHQQEWGTGQVYAEKFYLLKLMGFFEEVEPGYDFDVIYYDAFSPDVQPALWEEPMMRKMYESLSFGGLLVTYCAKGAFKRLLKSVGFKVESLPGPPGKREMTRALKM